MARTQAADYDDRRRCILEKAADLYAEKGYARSSISELAAACKASKSWLYHYYPSKEAILFDIMSFHMLELKEAAQRSLSEKGSTEERFRWLIRKFMSIYVESGSKHIILLNDLGCLSGAQQKEITDLQDQVVGIVLGLVLKMKPDLCEHPTYEKPVAMALMGMINWTHTWFRTDGPINHEQFADLAADLFLNGLQAMDFKA